jgi:hypothetical protein
VVALSEIRAGWAKPTNVQPVDGFLTRRGAHQARGLSTDAPQTCGSRATTRSGAHVRRSSPLSGVSSDWPHDDVNVPGGREPTEGRVRSRVKIPCCGRSRSRLSNGCSWSVRSPSFASLCEGGTSPRRGRWRQRIDHVSRGTSTLAIRSRTVPYPRRRLLEHGDSFSNCAAAGSSAEEQQPRMPRVSAISCAARREDSRGPPRTSPITGGRAQEPLRVSHSACGSSSALHHWL